MQLPEDDEIVMVAGTRPIRAKKARYYQDQDLMKRILKSEDPVKEPFPGREPDAWFNCRAEPPPLITAAPKKAENEKAKSDDGGHDRQQEFDEGKTLDSENEVKEKQNEFKQYYPKSREQDQKDRVLNNQMISTARQSDLDRDNPSNR